MASVLVVGVYLADRTNLADQIARELTRSRTHSVTQRWTALWTAGEQTARQIAVPHTVSSVSAPAPKFSLLNRMLEDADDFDWIIVADDDVELPDGWLDRYIDVANRYDLALSQPARTRDSYIDHHIVAQAPGLLARRTRFVEIGPVVCLRRDAIPHIIPFEDDVEMGWGLDFIWPVRIEAAGLRMGIIDACPVAHTLRAPVKYYDRTDTERRMQRLLSAVEHLSPAHAFTVLDAYADA